MLSGLGKTARKIVKRAAITGALEAANLIGGRPFGVSDRGQGVIFTLHHVRPRVEASFHPNAHLEITPEFLAETIEYVLDAGYVPVRLADVPAHLAGGDPTRPIAVFTLDDGYCNNLDHALPVFERFGVPFTVFVTTGFMDRTHAPWWETLVDLLNAHPFVEFDFGGQHVRFDLGKTYEKQVALEKIISFVADSEEGVAVDLLNRTATRHGMDPLAGLDGLVMDTKQVARIAQSPLCDIGAHTVSHRNLTRLSETDVADEINVSRDRIEQVTGKRPETFAYPYGFSSAVSCREVKIVRDLGFKLAVSTKPGTLTPVSQGRLMELQRISLNGLYQKQRYVKALTSGLPFRLLRA